MKQVLLLVMLFCAVVIANASEGPQTPYVDSDAIEDSTAPELVSFQHSFKNNVVKLIVKAKDDHEVTGIYVHCSLLVGPDHWHGEFVFLEYNRNLNQWELEVTLDSEVPAFRMPGLIEMEDELGNYAIIDALAQDITYKYQD